MDMKQSLLNQAEAAQAAADESEEAAARCDKNAAQYRLSAKDRRAWANEYRRLAATYDGVVDAEFDPDFSEVKQPAPTKQHNPQLQGYTDMFRSLFDGIFGTSKPSEPPEPPPTRHIKDGKETDTSKAETEAWADRVREATGRGLTVIGRANGAPPKVMNGNYETGKSIGMYAHWIAANPSVECDHEFVGKMEPGAFLTCLYCHRSRRIPDATE